MRGAIGMLWTLAGLAAPTHAFAPAESAGPAALESPVAVAASLIGSPPFVRHAPDLDVYPQNFAIGQDSRGIVFVGNTQGVLEFDGERWSLIALPNREIVRSLAVDANDRVYVGGYNTFGYLERDATGAARFVDLRPRFQAALGAREFADIWDTLVTPEGIYFRALREVFFWNPRDDSTGHWRHEGRFGAIAHYRGATLLQFRGEGFRRRKGDQWTPLPETAGLTELIFELLPLPDGGLLTLGMDGGWRRIGDGRVESVAMPAALPSSAHFQQATLLPDGSSAFVGAEGSVYIVDKARRSERHFKLDPTFLSGVTPAIDGGFLVAGNEAFYRVAWPTAWTVLSAEQGADGTLERLAHWNDSDYLLSSAGVFQLPKDARGAFPFQRVAWDADLWGRISAYDLVGIDADTALVGAAHHLMVLEDNTLRKLTEEPVYPRMLQRSHERPQRIYIGTENGLRYLDALASGYELSPVVAENSDMRVSSIVELSPRELWFGTERHGAWRVRLGDDGTFTRPTRFGADRGLALGTIPAAALARLADGGLIAATRKGFFRLVGDRFKADDLFGLEKLRREEELLTVVQAANGDLWAYGIGRLFHRPAGVQWFEQSVGHLRRGAFESHVLREDGRALFVATQSLLVYHGANGGVPRRKVPQVLLRSAALLQLDDAPTPLPLRPATPVRLPYGDYSLNFEFALPELTQERGRAYQVRLAGYQDKFSDWSPLRNVTFARLSPGSYSLEVRARDSLGIVSGIAPYALVIEPPWYLRWWAQVAYAATGSVLLWWGVRRVVRRRTSRLAQEKDLLEQTVADRTRDLAVANRRLESMAHLDGLTGIANRRRLDDYLAAVWTQGRDRQRPVAVLAIDVDHFKQFNDTHGHLAGDQLLKRLVLRLSRCLRRSEDLLARYGGEEFVAVLPGASMELAHLVAENMRRDIEASELGATISIGVASTIPDGGDVVQLIDAADTALYAAKHAGRNRVVASQTTPGE